MCRGWCNVTTINERGQIIGDCGIGWLRSQHGYWSYDPYGFRIERVWRNVGETLWWAPDMAGYDRTNRINATSISMWRLYRETSTNVANVTIFIGSTVGECMRAAEIYQVRRV